MLRILILRMLYNCSTLNMMSDFESEKPHVKKPRTDKETLYDSDQHVESSDESEYSEVILIVLIINMKGVD